MSLASWLPALGAWAVVLTIMLLRDPVARTLGILDVPNEIRKLHARPTPKVGGLSFCLASLWGLAALSLWVEPPEQGTILAAGLVLFHFLLGLIDDRWDIDAKWRLILSFAVCGYLFWANEAWVIHELRFSFGTIITLPRWTGLGLTIAGVVFFIFAVNLMDGRNGVLGFSAAWWLGMLQMMATPLDWPIFIGVLGCLALFLWFNADGRVFAGDSGAYLLASAIVLLGLHSYSDHKLSFDQFGVLFLMPALDAARVLLWRLARGSSPFRGGRDHLHHILWDRAGPILAPFLYGVTAALPSLIAMAMPKAAILMLPFAAILTIAMAYWPHRWRPRTP